MAVGIAAAPAWAQTADHIYKLNIPREPLERALKDFANQTGLQIARFSDRIDGKVLVGPIGGELSVQKALHDLLAPSGLTFKMINERTIAVVEEGQHSSNVHEPPGASDSGTAESPAPARAPASRQDALESAAASASGPQEAPQSKDGPAATSADQVTITGSRIRTNNPTAEVMVIDRDTIDKSGFSTVEDIVRSLPQNLSTSNSVRGVTQPVSSDGSPVGPAGQGESEANLRGLGQGATLVLIDGHRTSGSAAFAGDAVNLASIPVAAIERVEILSDSAAAVYGSDAIAGVINIVLRKNYQGANSSVRYEDGANGGDKTALDQLLGLNWGSGNVTATVSASHTLPIESSRVGYTTNNLVSQGGVDARNPYIGQPGVLSYGKVSGSLPSTYSGLEQWTAANISQANVQPADLIRPEYSSDERSGQLYLSARQTVTDRVEAFGDVRWSDNHEEATGAAPILSTTISATNPYNRLGAPVNATYAPIYEVNNGLIPRPVSENVLRNLSVDSGLRVQLPVRDWKLEITGTYSKSQSKSAAFGYNTYSYVTLGSTPFAKLLPSELNPFGNGTAQNIALLDSGYGASTAVTDRGTALDGVTVSAEGSVITLPAGDLRMAGGGEFRHESLYYGADDYYATSINKLADLHPAQNSGAVFGEASVPILKSLTSSLQARWEHYAIASSDAAIDGKTFSKLTPRLGLAWQGPDRLLLRASWGRSFKAPGLNDLALAPKLGTSLSSQYDPIQQQTALVYVDRHSNLDLKPEQGETVTAGFTWSPPEADGLQVSANYNRTRFSDQILSSLLSNLGTLSVTDVLANPNLFPGIAVRAPDGTLLRVEDGPINVSSVTVRTVDFNVNYDRTTAWGVFSAGVQGIVTLSYDQQLLPLVPVQDLAGTTSMDKRRARLSLGWSRGRYGLNLYGNYTGPYLDTEIINLNSGGLQVPPLPVRSRTTWDMSGFYEAPWGVKISGGVKDLFSAKFPLAQGDDGPYDTRRVDLRGRVIYAGLQKSFNF